MVFNYEKDDRSGAEIKKRALAVLLSYCEGHGHGEIDLDGPIVGAGRPQSVQGANARRLPMVARGGAVGRE